MGDSGPILGVYAEFGGRESVGPARFERARPYLACGRVPSDSLNGAAALVGRGNCTFEDKCRAVQSAGAVACVVVNTGQGAFEMGLGEESQLRLGGGLPSIMVGSSVGDQLVGHAGDAERGRKAGSNERMQVARRQAVGPNETARK